MNIHQQYNPEDILRLLEEPLDIVPDDSWKNSILERVQHRRYKRNDRIVVIRYMVAFMLLLAINLAVAGYYYSVSEQYQKREAYRPIAQQFLINLGE